MKKLVELTSIKKSRNRFIVLAYLMIAGIAVVTFGLGWVQVIKGDIYKKKARAQQRKIVVEKAARGNIYDRNGKELTRNSTSYELWFSDYDIVLKGNDKQQREKKKLEYIKKAVPLIEQDTKKQNDLYNKLVNVRSRYKIKSGIGDKLRTTFKQNPIPGFSIEKHSKRVYPMGTFLANTLGFVNSNGDPQSGVELAYNEVLSGTPGKRIYEGDSSGNNLEQGEKKIYKPKNGKGLVLTIDEVIQNYCERAVNRVKKKSAADNVYCVMMNPKNGDILGLAVTPSYDPNHPKKLTGEYKSQANKKNLFKIYNSMWKNPVVSNLYEPGSTFKLISAAIALQEGKISPGERFYCAGKIKIADAVLKCWYYPKAHGSQTLAQAVANSCNPAFVNIANRIGKEKYRDYLDLFGITQKTGIGLPGEGSAIVRSKKEIGPVELSTMGYGHGIALTPIQLATAISSFGNNGVLMKPRLVKGYADTKGKLIKKFAPESIRKVISKKTADRIRLLMEEVVDKGSGQNAKIKGYRIGGKTGTTLKTKGHGYGKKVFASFVGMAPIDDPKICLLVVVDNPANGASGSLSAGPAAKEILENTLKYMLVKPK